MDPKALPGRTTVHAGTIKNFRRIMPSQDIADGERYRAMREAFCVADGATTHRQFDAQADKIVLAGGSA